MARTWYDHSGYSCRKICQYFGCWSRKREIFRIFSSTSSWFLCGISWCGQFLTDDSRSEGSLCKAWFSRFTNAGCYLWMHREKVWCYRVSCFVSSSENWRGAYSGSREFPPSSCTKWENIHDELESSRTGEIYPCTSGKWGFFNKDWRVFPILSWIFSWGAWKYFLALWVYYSGTSDIWGGEEYFFCTAIDSWRHKWCFGYIVWFFCKSSKVGSFFFP